jgi:hypothetical protein
VGSSLRAECLIAAVSIAIIPIRRSLLSTMLVELYDADRLELGRDDLDVLATITLEDSLITLEDSLGRGLILLQDEHPRIALARLRVRRQKRAP